MKRPTKSSDGLYHIKGKTYKLVRGSRAQVWNHTALKTEGGLLRSELTKSHGRIVSLKKHKTAKKELRLQKYGFFAKKGKFGYVKKDITKKRRGSRKVRGGGLAENASSWGSSTSSTATSTPASSTGPSFTMPSATTSAVTTSSFTTPSITSASFTTSGITTSK